MPTEKGEHGSKTRSLITRLFNRSNTKVPDVEILAEEYADLIKQLLGNDSDPRLTKQFSYTGYDVIAAGSGSEGVGKKLDLGYNSDLLCYHLDFLLQERNRQNQSLETLNRVNSFGSDALVATNQVLENIEILDRHIHDFIEQISVTVDIDIEQIKQNRGMTDQGRPSLLKSVVELNINKLEDYKKHHESSIRATLKLGKGLNVKQQNIKIESASNRTNWREFELLSKQEAIVKADERIGASFDDEEAEQSDKAILREALQDGIEMIFDGTIKIKSQDGTAYDFADFLQEYINKYEGLKNALAEPDITIEAIKTCLEKKLVRDKSYTEADRLFTDPQFKAFLKAAIISALQNQILLNPNSKKDNERKRRLESNINGEINTTIALIMQTKTFAGGQLISSGILANKKIQGLFLDRISQILYENPPTPAPNVLPEQEKEQFKQHQELGKALDSTAIDNLKWNDNITEAKKLTSVATEQLTSAGNYNEIKPNPYPETDLSEQLKILNEKNSKEKITEFNDSKADEIGKKLEEIGETYNRLDQAGNTKKITQTQCSDGRRILSSNLKVESEVLQAFISIDYAAYITQQVSEIYRVQDAVARKKLFEGLSKQLNTTLEKLKDIQKIIDTFAEYESLNLPDINAIKLLITTKIEVLDVSIEEIGNISGFDEHHTKQIENGFQTISNTDQSMQLLLDSASKLHLATESYRKTLKSSNQRLGAKNKFLNEEQSLNSVKNQTEDLQAIALDVKTEMQDYIQSEADFVNELNSLQPQKHVTGAFYFAKFLFKKNGSEQQKFQQEEERSLNNNDSVGLAVLVLNQLLQHVKSIKQNTTDFAATNPHALSNDIIHLLEIQTHLVSWMHALQTDLQIFNYTEGKPELFRTILSQINDELQQHFTEQLEKKQPGNFSAHYQTFLAFKDTLDNAFNAANNLLVLPIKAAPTEEGFKNLNNHIDIVLKLVVNEIPKAAEQLEIVATAPVKSKLTEIEQKIPENYNFDKESLQYLLAVATEISTEIDALSQPSLDDETQSASIEADFLVLMQTLDEILQKYQVAKLCNKQIDKSINANQDLDKKLLELKQLHGTLENIHKIIDTIDASITNAVSPTDETTAINELKTKLNSERSVYLDSSRELQRFIHTFEISTDDLRPGVTGELNQFVQRLAIFDNDTKKFFNGIFREHITNFGELQANPDVLNAAGTITQLIDASKNFSVEVQKIIDIFSRVPNPQAIQSELELAKGAFDCQAWWCNEYEQMYKSFEQFILDTEKKHKDAFLGAFEAVLDQQIQPINEAITNLSTDPKANVKEIDRLVEQLFILQQQLKNIADNLVPFESQNNELQELKKLVESNIDAIITKIQNFKAAVDFRNSTDQPDVKSKVDFDALLDLAEYNLQLSKTMLAPSDPTDVDTNFTTIEAQHGVISKKLTQVALQMAQSACLIPRTSVPAPTTPPIEEPTSPNTLSGLKKIIVGKKATPFNFPEHRDKQFQDVSDVFVRLEKDSTSSEKPEDKLGRLAVNINAQLASAARIAIAVNLSPQEKQEAIAISQNNITYLIEAAEQLISAYDVTTLTADVNIIITITDQKQKKQ
ncbi:MAG: hypothetical protein AAGG80_02050, partial [Pseudomonadota bacterium]